MQPRCLGHVWLCSDVRGRVAVGRRVPVAIQKRKLTGAGASGAWLSMHREKTAWAVVGVKKAVAEGGPGSSRGARLHLFWCAPAKRRKKTYGPWGRKRAEAWWASCRREKTWDFWSVAGRGLKRQEALLCMQHLGHEQARQKLGCNGGIGPQKLGPTLGLGPN